MVLSHGWGSACAQACCAGEHRQGAWLPRVKGSPKMCLLALWQGCAPGIPTPLPLSCSGTKWIWLLLLLKGVFKKKKKRRGPTSSCSHRRLLTHCLLSFFILRVVFVILNLEESSKIISHGFFLPSVLRTNYPVPLEMGSQPHTSLSAGLMPGPGSPHGWVLRAPQAHLPCPCQRQEEL